MTARNRARLVVAVAVVATAGGCGGEPTAAVSGTVTDRDGTPVNGVIVFFPQDGAKYRDAAEAPIVNGGYDLPKVSVGTKFVTVMVNRDNQLIDARLTPDSAELQPGPQAINFSLRR